ncbi:NADPH:quinone reductase [Sphingopyxis sp. 113P3]|nr:NADPH:quinone reductase [Sphingopyxis sp. 113P3]
MGAVLCRRQAGAAEAILEDVEMARPAATAPRDLLVRIEAASLNPIDRKRRAARPLLDPTGAVLGWSAVGVVEETGTGVRRFVPGQRIWYAGASERPGSFAEFQLVDERIAGRAPTGLAAEQAAAMPLAGLTAAEALYDHLSIDRAGPGHVILINGGGGAVASLAVQLARRNPAVEIIATAGSPQSREWLLHVGADHVVGHRICLWQQVRQLGCPAPRSIISMYTNKRSWESYIAMLQPFGHICLADHPGTLDIGAARAKSLTLHWQAMFTRPAHLGEASCRQGELLAELARLCDERAITPFPVRPAAPLSAASVAAAMDQQQNGGPRPVFVPQSRMN